MKKIDKKNIIYFFIIFCFSLIIFIEYLNGHFSADTFNIINIGYKNYAIKNSLLDGRLFMSIIGLIAHKINIPILTYVIVLQILAIFVTCIIILKLKKIILEYKKIKNKWQEIFIILVCYFTIFNFTYLENMYFVECFVMGLSILFYIISAKSIIKKEVLKGFIYLILGLLSYQGTISAFFIFLILFSMLEEKNLKEILQIFIKGAIIFSIALILNNILIILTEKIFNITQTRGINITNIFSNILYIIYISKDLLIKTANLFPNYLFIFFVIIISIIIILKMNEKNRKSQSKRNEIILIEQMIIIVLCIIFALGVSGIRLTAINSGRIRFSMGATIGIVFIHLIVKTDILEIITKYDKILIGIFIIYSIINSINYIYLINLNKQANKQDEIKVNEIEEYLKEYEKLEKIKVEKVCGIVIKNNCEKAFYSKNSKEVGIAVSCLRTEWALQGIINYYTSRNLKKEELTEEDRKEYLDKVDENKNYLCIGNTLYVSIYWY